MYRFVVTFALAILLAIAGKALTQTPDTQPPAVEAPCAGLTGAAYGLCNAYCEAQDCDVHARPSCERLRTKYKKLTNDDLFPCDRPPCGSAEAPECDGTCDPGLTCVAGPEAGGAEGTGCACLPPCEDAEAPSCGGACPDGFLCFGGPENGGTDFSGSDESDQGCACRLPCGAAEAPQCDGACPYGGVCTSGPEDGGAENGGPEEGGPEGTQCSCAIFVRS